MYNEGMKRTTIMAPQELLDRLQSIAQREQVSLAEVIRQGLEWRVAQAEQPPQFIGAGTSTEPPYTTGRRAGEIAYTPRSWR